ncbi:MAG: LPS assembly protein LptD [Phycisphaerales bacterium]
MIKHTNPARPIPYHSHLPCTSTHLLIRNIQDLRPQPTYGKHSNTGPQSRSQRRKANPRMPTHPTTAHTLIAGLALCAGSVTTLAASATHSESHSATHNQSSDSQSNQSQPDQSPDSFDQIDLALEPIDGIITLGAGAGWLWKQGTTTNILLNRDVNVQIGSSIVTAKAARLWLRPLQTNSSTPTYQVFGVFKDLRSTDNAFTGKLVPIRAIVNLQDSIALNLGAQLAYKPTRKDLQPFMDQADELYTSRLLSQQPQLDQQTSQQPEQQSTTLRWAPKELSPAPATPEPQVARTLPDPASQPTRSRVQEILDQTVRASRNSNPESSQIARQDPSAIQTPQNAQLPKDLKLIQDPSNAQSDSASASRAAKPTQPIFQASGIFSISIEGKLIAQGAQEATTTTDARPATITADGGVRLQYQDPATRQSMDLEAERAVIFLTDDQAGSTSTTQLNASQIEGIYLEGGVFAGNEDWSVRSPKVYVDLVNDKMLMLDAVFWTVDERTNMPLYLRASYVRQTSQGEFEADRARIANSSFFEPDISVGVSKLKVSIRDEQPRRTGLLGLVGSVGDRFASDQSTSSASSSNSALNSGSNLANIEPGSDLVRRVFVEGKNVTLRLGSVPVFWLPSIKGNTDAFPLKEVRIGDSNRSGLALRTKWDAYSLLGIDPIDDVKARVAIDYYGERGFAFGLESSWNTQQHRGSLYSYILPDDDGFDVLATGQEIDRTGEVRGMISINDIWKLDEAWTLITQGNYISDEAYIPAFEDQLGREATDFDSMLRLERTSERTQFGFEISGSPNDFIAAEHLLQSPGYAVDKLPEASFVSTGQDLFPEWMPGVFEYQYEASIGSMRLRFSEATAAEYGFDTPALANAAFGTAPGVSLADTQRALGLNEDNVSRFDTRHEISARFDAGPVTLTPFVVGRVTAYDTSFDTFTPGQTDDIRYWGAVGMTASTTLTRINDNASSDFFDIHRIRHIIEPSVTIWQADSGFAVGDTPVFDDDVEDLLRGTMFRAAIDQTWQTKRGGAGRWRDADILKLNTEYVWTSDRAGNSIIPDYFEARPELSNPGTYVGSELIFSPTDVLAFSGSAVFDIDADQISRSSTGVLVEHRPGFTSSLEYRDIRAIDATFLTGSNSYILTDKYAVSTAANYNFDRGDFQNFFFRLERKFQMGTLGISVNFDNIRSETSIGVVFRPFGTTGTTFAGDGGFFQQ